MFWKKKKKMNTETTTETIKPQEPEIEFRQVDEEPVKVTGWKGLFLPKANKTPKMNRTIFATCILVVLLFFALIGYMIRFMVLDSKKVISNPYNQRTQNLSEQVVRGQIVSADGEILAQTTQDEFGNEIRNYPFDSIFSHVVGYSSHGKGGLESAYNYELLTSHANIVSQIENGISSKKNPGDNIITTLDSQLQEAAFYALGDYQGVVVAIEPSTGKIRAMVSKPDFNPNSLDDIWSDIVNDESSSVLLNRCISGLYPPGSTYKVIPLMEYIRENPYTYEDFSYDCDGETIVDSVRIKCYQETEHGEESLEDAFTHSCNTAFVTLGSGLNRSNYIKLHDELYFNKTIPFELNIKKSQFKITGRSDKSQLPQTIIGQGDTLMTPLHNALIMCAIANNGSMMKPMLTEKIESADGYTVKKMETKELTTIDNEAGSIGAIQTMLRKVITDGTGYALQDDDYTVAGKTGTAENGGEKSHSWFVGYSNVDDPDLVVCVIAENTGAGSKYAAPIAKEIFDTYYEKELDKKYR